MQDAESTHQKAHLRLCRSVEQLSSYDIFQSPAKVAGSRR
jgi:hypothetical protein